MKHAHALLCSIAVYLAFAGASDATDSRALRLTYEPWSKFCLAKTGCFVGMSARGECQPSGGAITIIINDGAPESLTAYFGTKRGPVDAISVQIDQNSPIPMPDTRCNPFGCWSRLTIGVDMIEQLRRAQSVTISDTDAAHQETKITFPLADFAHAYDAAGAEPKVFEETQKQLKAELQQRGKELSPTPLCED
jgi:invasion protein IalB